MSFWDAFGRSFGPSVQSGSAAGANLVARRIAADERRANQAVDDAYNTAVQSGDPNQIRNVIESLGPDDARREVLEAGLGGAKRRQMDTRIKHYTDLPTAQVASDLVSGRLNTETPTEMEAFRRSLPAHSAKIEADNRTMRIEDAAEQRRVAAEQEAVKQRQEAMKQRDYNATLRSWAFEDREHTLTQQKWDKAKNLGGTGGIDYLVGEGLISEEEAARRNNKLRQKDAIEQLQLDVAQQSYLNQRLRTREEIFQAEIRLNVLRTELGTAKKVGERTLWFDRDLTPEEVAKLADMQASIKNQEAIISEAKASLGDIPAGGGTSAPGPPPGDGSDIRNKILNNQGDGGGEPAPSPAENSAAAAILGKLGSADLDIIPEPRDASAYEPSRNVRDPGSFMYGLPVDELRDAWKYLFDKDYYEQQTGRISPAERISNPSAENLPQRNKNPGNVKRGGLGDEYAMKNADGTPKTDKDGHLIFETPEDGFLALQADINAKLEGKSRHGTFNTLSELGSVYAEDRNWADGVGRILGVPADTPLGQIDREKLIDAIARQEGFYAES